MKFKDLKIGDYFLFADYYHEGDDISDIISSLKTDKTSYVSLDGEWEDKSFKDREVIRLKPHFEKMADPILDEAEKRYLEAVIRPWKENVWKITKNIIDGEEYICIQVVEKTGYEHGIKLPRFERGTMYNGMNPDKWYTLKGLGLFEDE